MKEFEKYIQKNKSIPFFNQYSNKETTRWDYYAGDERFEDEEESERFF